MGLLIALEFAAELNLMAHTRKLAATGAGSKIPRARRQCHWCKTPPNAAARSPCRAENTSRKVAGIEDQSASLHCTFADPAWSPNPAAVSRLRNLGVVPGAPGCGSNVLM